MKEAHSDYGGSEAEFRRVTAVKKAMLEKDNDQPSILI